jgi:hypothetical protein
MGHVRCTAPAKDLDSGQHVRHSQPHTELLVEEFELSMLWDEYGLVIPSWLLTTIIVIF